MGKLDKPEELIEQTVEIANEARKGDLQALEGKETENAFLAKGIQLTVGGHEPKVVRQRLITDMHSALERLDVGKRIFKSIGDTAPAIGMIGTLIGLARWLIVAKKNESNIPFRLPSMIFVKTIKIG